MKKEYSEIFGDTVDTALEEGLYVDAVFPLWLLDLKPVHHTIAVAATAKAIAEYLSQPTDRVVKGGLIHDLGKRVALSRPHALDTDRFHSILLYPYIEQHRQHFFGHGYDERDVAIAARHSFSSYRTDIPPEMTLPHISDLDTIVYRLNGHSTATVPPLNMEEKRTAAILRIADHMVCGDEPVGLQQRLQDIASRYSLSPLYAQRVQRQLLRICPDLPEEHILAQAQHNTALYQEHMLMRAQQLNNGHAHMIPYFEQLGRSM